jgi:hypothetical protein
MVPVGKIRVLALLAIASVGLMAGHSLTYLRLTPSLSGRAAMLESSGHSYFDKALAFAPALALMCALYWLATGFMRSRHGRPSPLGMASALAVIQTIGFGGQEVIERLMAGAPLHHLGTVLLLGIPLQLIVAAVGALLVTALHRAGEKLAELLWGTGPARRSSAPHTFARSISFTSAVLAGDLRPRGPPVLSS